MTNEQTVPARFDRASMQAAAVLALCLGAMAAFIVYDRLSNGGAWRGLPGRGWLLAFAASLLACVVLAALDVTRRKNIAWRALRARFAEPVDPAPDRKNYGAGKVRLAGYAYWGARSFGSTGGLVVMRVLSVIHRPLHVPWSAIAHVEAYPNVLTGNPGFETDMGARVTIRGERSVTLEVPWLAEFRNFMPKTVKFRLVKLPEQS